MKHEHDDHSNHATMHIHGPVKDDPREYAKFGLVITAVLALSFLFHEVFSLPFTESLMGVFLVTFAGFKLINLKVFAYGFQSYDLLAKRSLQYSYLYPFIQLTIGLLYMMGFASTPLHIVALLVASIAAAGVLKSLLGKNAVHCVCLGNVVKLPLSRISFVEDFGMALMALTMILL